MKKSLIAIIVVVAAIALLGFVMGPKFYNTGIELKETATAQWGNVESSYQRRADLIPNIVSTAKGYAEFEQETLIKVTEARSKATSITIDPSNITPAQLEQFQQAQQGLTSALSRLLAVFERYPDLKANENFKELINELERTENRINVERNRFNEAVLPFNKHLKTFPNVLINKFIGKFEEMAYFKADEGTQDAPKVDFDFGKDKE
ncbi:LemA family protein [Ulvibacter antarcticus]|uniref:LemA protein n=1 Tax=Ulvibacter antarcticus TaxID=442714 RepID=A0A3L9Y976_9FLAO|nr:LemA family protein [Ulvibacter antarcticus]RMA57256.1 LemA protein [Ulvibacter antarcticus]